MHFMLAFLVAVATWHVGMAVECAGRCARKPKLDRPRVTAPQCKGNQCQKPLPAPLSSSR